MARVSNTVFIENSWAALTYLYIIGVYIRDVLESCTYWLDKLKSVGDVSRCGILLRLASGHFNEPAPGNGNDSDLIF